MHWLTNLVIYQATWFICVLGGSQLAWIPLLLIAFHLYVSPCRKADAMMIAALTSFGVVLDGTLVSIGFFFFPDSSFIIPYWLLVIWMALATLPNHSLKWLKNRLVLAGILGALGGPLAYWAGVRLGAAAFNWPLLQSILVLAVVWGAFFPAVMLFSNRTLSPSPIK